MRGETYVSRLHRNCGDDGRRRELNERRSRRRRGEVTFEDRRKEYRFANPILTYEAQR
jgi:hypothetical protein